ncbi:MAG: thiamine-phosphate kinase [Gammaproteobacteria bacterium]|nr:MAG: thiamine-phosphate kinase [Gammaproteobacteria bacterium]
MAGEFDIIQRYFRFPQGQGVVLGPGDDCALLAPEPGQQLAVTSDVLVEGVHFPEEAAPDCIGYKALAVNLSDLAAQGAEPLWVTLGLTLPHAEEAWLAGFAGGLRRLLERHHVSLVGGDTTRGPLAIAVTALGQVPPDAVLRRSGASPGDLICVSGTVGDAGLALMALQGEVSLPADAWQQVAPRLHAPEPRVALGLALRGVASACIDISDGLLADLGHLLDASAVGAVLRLEAVPFSAPVRQWLDAGGDPLRLLSAGDDYELLFTLPPEREARLSALAETAGVALTVIGEVQQGTGIRLFTPSGEAVRVKPLGYDHFGND